MLFDFQRTLPLLRAIQKELKSGDIVVDIGCGLGILTFAACHAGAKRVYAIEVDGKALEFALWQAKKLGVDKKICWIEDHSQNVDLIEKADLLIQETIGPLAFDENFLPTLMDAKKRFLKRGGKIIPEAVSLYGAPVGIGKKLLSKPVVLKKVIAHTTRQTNPHIQKTWRLQKGVGRLSGVLVWPHIVWAKGLVTDCSPLSKPTHWRQTFLPCGTRYHTVREVKFSLKIRPHPKNPLYNTKIEWQIRSPYESKRFKTRSRHYF